MEKRVQGHTDNLLNATGIAQAKMTAETLEKDHPDIKAIYSSDLSRAYFTAKESAQKFNLPIEIRTTLREINTGISEGLKTSEKVDLYKDQWKELDALYPDKWDRWKYSPIPGEETIYQLIERVWQELENIVQVHPNEKIAIFSHGKAITAFIAAIEDKNLNESTLPNCSIVEIHYDSENPIRPFQLVSIH